MIEIFSRRPLQTDADPDIVCLNDETGAIAYYAVHPRLPGAQDMPLATLIEPHRIRLTPLTPHLTIRRVRR